MLVIDTLVNLVGDEAQFEPCIFKLASGDLLATMACPATDEYYILMHPTKFVSSVDEDGYMTTSLVRYIFGSDDELVELRKSTIISSAYMTQELYNKYSNLCQQMWVREEKEDAIETADTASNVISFNNKTKH